MLKLPFELKVCPGECGKPCGTEPARCPAYLKLPPELQEKCADNPHLLQYLHSLPMDELGVPEYHETLNRGMSSINVPNLIYPVDDHVFVHILGNPGDIRSHYIPVEPSLAEGLDSFIDGIEDRIADYVDELEGLPDAAARVDVVLKIAERVVEVRSPGGNGSGRSQKNKNNGKGNGNGRSKDKIIMTPLQYLSLPYLLRRKLEGLGVLEPLMRDNYIEDISCSGLGSIFVEHKIFRGCTTAITFETHEELDKFVIQLAEGIKRPVTFREPCVDATLPDGSRINIVYGTDVSKRGSNFTIRKFTPVPMSIMELIQTGALNYEMAGYLSLIIQEGMNLWVSGETASGKTTLMNGLCTFVAPDAKIVSIEDTPEVQVPHHNWIRGVTRGSAKTSESSEVSMFDLLKAALRQRPNIIIVGEIRGAEGAIAFQAMQTGHACMSTFHAATVTKLIQRVTADPINVPKSYVDNLNVVVICSMVRLPNGKKGRRIISINEIISYDSSSDSFSYIEVFSWNPVNDTFDFRGYNNSYLLEYKIAPKRGIPHNERRQIYTEIKKRAKVLQRIQEQKITNFYDLHDILSKAYREGNFR